MKPKIKYIYGRSERLGNILKPGGKLRFSDIFSYLQLENENIRDDEGKKVFLLEKHEFKSLTVNDQIILSSQFVGPLKIGLPVPRCHTLCMSETGFSQALFERFKADICLEVDLNMLLDILKGTLHKKENNPKIVHRKVKYIDSLAKIKFTDPEHLIFCKSKKYKIENEYRLAVIWPFGDNTVIHHQDKKIPVFSDENWFDLGFQEPQGMRIIVKSAKKSTGDLIFSRDKQ